MLEQLFGSKTRAHLLQLFLNHPTEPFYLRQLARQLKTQLNSVRREVNNLEKIGIIKSVDAPPVTNEESSDDTAHPGTKKYFVTDVNFILYPELKGLLMKAQLLTERSFIKRIENLKKVEFLLLTGIFVGLDYSPTDILVVGDVNKRELTKIMKEFEKKINRQINYTLMSTEEYRYRRDITDRFLYSILEGPKVLMIDLLNVKR